MRRAHINLCEREVTEKDPYDSLKSMENVKSPSLQEMMP